MENKKIKLRLKNDENNYCTCSISTNRNILKKIIKQIKKNELEELDNE